MASKFEVPADRLASRCDPSLLPFTCTGDMTPLEDFIGQERAMRAMMSAGSRGLWETRGVLMPKSNLRHLMRRPGVVEVVK